MADGQKVVASTPKTTRNAPDLFYAYASLIHITAYPVISFNKDSLWAEIAENGHDPRHPQAT
ncbi:hypothetical protein KZ870_33270 [Pseudomonas aeruginosa]|nr:hypothetical protein [Pseudomonas aeruginosa]